MDQPNEEVQKLSSSYTFESPLKIIDTQSHSDRKNSLRGYVASTQYGLAPTEMIHSITSGEEVKVDNQGRVTFSGIPGRSFDPEKLLMGLVTHKKDRSNANIFYPHLDSKGKVEKVSIFSIPDGKRENMEKAVLVAISEKYNTAPKRSYYKGDRPGAFPTGQDAANILGVYKRAGKILELLGKDDDVFMMDMNPFQVIDAAHYGQKPFPENERATYYRIVARLNQPEYQSIAQVAAIDPETFA
jgi:hypothetical protein